MTKDELLKKLREAASTAEDDAEVGHLDADQALLDYINDVDVHQAFDAVKKWYA